jgi:hypothetical protein
MDARELRYTLRLRVILSIVRRAEGVSGCPDLSVCREDEGAHLQCCMGLMLLYNDGYRGQGSMTGYQRYIRYNEYLDLPHQGYFRMPLVAVQCCVATTSEYDLVDRAVFSDETELH